MSDGITISISDEVWQKRLLAYAAATGKAIRAVLDEEWPLMIRKIISFTPPFKTKGAPGVSDLSVGRAAVSRDIAKVMRTFDPAEIRSPGLRKIVATGDIEGFNIVAGRAESSLMRGATAIKFSPAVHTAAQDPRGRVPGRNRNQVVIGSDATNLRKYIASKQDDVGYARSGWAAAYNLVKDPEGPGLPNWVTRHGTGGGEVIDDRENADNPSITGINWTPWAIRKNEWERITADAFFSRLSALGTKTRVAMRLAAEQAGFQSKAA